MSTVRAAGQKTGSNSVRFYKIYKIYIDPSAIRIQNQVKYRSPVQAIRCRKAAGPGRGFVERIAHQMPKIEEETQRSQAASRMPKNSLFFEKLVPVILVVFSLITLGLVAFAVGILTGLILF